MLIDSSTSGFNLALILVQDLLLQSLLKVTTPLEDVRVMFNVFILKKKWFKHFLIDLFSLLHFMQFSFVTF